MKTRYKLVATFLLLNISANYAAIDQYLWDNQEGFISVANCSADQASSIPLHLLTPNAKWKSEDNKTLATVSGLSLVKSLDINSLLELQEVQIIVKPTQSGDDRYLMNQDKVFANKQDLKDLDQYYFNKKPNFAVIKTLNQVETNLSYLKVSKSDGQYNILNCSQEGIESRTYTLFDLFNTNDTLVAQVGIYAGETHILKATKVSTKKEQVTSDDLDHPTSDHSILDQDALDLLNQDQKRVDQDLIYTSSVSYTVCSEAELIDVKSANGQTLFKARRFEQVLPIENWNNDSNLTQVKFPYREEQDQVVGWVTKDIIKLDSQCNLKRPVAKSLAGKQSIKSLTDSKCCQFPTVKRPRLSYVENNVRRFGASRGARRHGGSDLYRYKNEPIVAVAPGKVLFSLRWFYYNSFQLTLKHNGGFAVRYGEITNKKAPKTGPNDQIKAGARIGYIQQILTEKRNKQGKVIKKGNLLPPMLHFELYTGKASGALRRSLKESKYARRSDLIDPTKYLQKWEKKTFGKSW